MGKTGKHDKFIHVQNLDWIIFITKTYVYQENSTPLLFGRLVSTESCTVQADVPHRVQNIAYLLEIP